MLIHKHPKLTNMSRQLETVIYWFACYHQNFIPVPIDCCIVIINSVLQVQHYICMCDVCMYVCIMYVCINSVVPSAGDQWRVVSVPTSLCSNITPSTTPSTTPGMEGLARMYTGLAGLHKQTHPLTNKHTNSFNQFTHIHNTHRYVTYTLHR